MDLANKLKGKLNDLMMKSPMLAKALDMANSFSMNLMTDIMSDAMFSAALDMLGRYGDNNIVLAAGIILGSHGGPSKSPPKGKDVYGPHYEEAKSLHEQYPDFFGDPDNHTIVQGKELANMRKEYDDYVSQGRLERGHHRDGLAFGGKNVPENIVFTGETTIQRSKLDGVDLDFYKQYGKPNAKVLKLHQQSPGGIIVFGNNDRHTMATNFQNKVLRWQREVGLRGKSKKKGGKTKKGKGT